MIFEFRKTEIKDVEQLEKIFESAKLEMKKRKIDQWQKGYPNRTSILEDIKKSVSYVIVENEKVMATAVLTFERETSYENIEEGKWLTDNEAKYGVIHRIAVNTEMKNKGYAIKLLELLEREAEIKGMESIRVDTHEENQPMNNFLRKNNYIYCGIIYLDEEPDVGEKRLAYEKVLKNEKIYK